MLCVCVCVILGVLSVMKIKVLLGYDVLIYNLSPTFRSSLLPQSSGLSRNKLLTLYRERVYRFDFHLTPLFPYIMQGSVPGRSTALKTEAVSCSETCLVPEDHNLYVLCVLYLHYELTVP
jgi:hypothetical protein